MRTAGGDAGDSFGGVTGTVLPCGYAILIWWGGDLCLLVDLVQAGKPIG